MTVIFDSFSGAAAGLPKGKRTPEHVLAALRRNPRVSTWDMSEHRWLRNAIYQLLDEGKIEDLSAQEGFPWHRYRVVDRAALADGEGN